MKKKKQTPQTESYKIHSSQSVFFDDCPICRLMQKAEKLHENVSFSELKTALAEAKKIGQVIEGPEMEPGTQLVNISKPFTRLSRMDTDPWFDEIESYFDEDTSKSKT